MPTVAEPEVAEPETAEPGNLNRHPRSSRPTESAMLNVSTG